MSFRLLNTECFIFSGTSDNKSLVGTILPAHANLGFHFYLVSMLELFYQQKIHIHPHNFCLTLAHSRSI